MGSLSKIENATDLKTMGELFARSGFFADSREAAQAAVKILAGQELGFGPFASMTGIHVIKGKCAVSSTLLAAAIKRSGRYNYNIIENTDTATELHFTDSTGKKIGVSRFTMEDAKAAGLTSNDTYRKFPRNMLFARAMSNGAKWFCADVFGGPIYTPDELGAVVNEEGDVVEVAEPKRLAAPAAPKAPEPVADSPAKPAPSEAAKAFFAAVKKAANGDKDVAGTIAAAVCLAMGVEVADARTGNLPDEVYAEMVKAIETQSDGGGK